MNWLASSQNCKKQYEECYIMLIIGVVVLLVLDINQTNKQTTLLK